MKHKVALLLILVSLFLGVFFLINIGRPDLFALFFLVFAQFALGFFIFAQDPRKEINLSFFFYSSSVAVWTFLAIIVTQMNRGSDSVFWDKAIFIPATLMLGALFYFSTVFPRKNLNHPRIVTWGVFSLASIVALLVPFGLIIRGTETKGGAVSPVFGQAYPLFVLFALVCVALSLFNFVKSYNSSSGLAKNQLRYMFFGLFLLCLGLVITNLLLPWFNYPEAAQYGAVVPIFPLAFTAYAIVKTRLMDISVVISRTVAELLTVVVHTVGYLVLVWLYLQYFSASIKPLFLIGSMVYGYLVAQTHQPFRLFFQTSADKLFLHGKYNYYRALSDASSRVGEKLSLPEILKVLYETFYDVVEIKNPRVYLPESFTEIEKSSTCYLPYDKTTAQPLPKGVPIPLKGELVSRLIASRQPVYEVKELEAEIIVPCLLEDRLIAIFVLGPKLSEDRYTEEDLRLLEILANQVAIALDHTRSYEKIKLELEATERQLERSQRLASIGTLTAGVTHEIRNPLTVIRAETERLPNQPRDQQYLKEHSQLVLRHIDRIVGIVQRMLSLAKEKPKQQKAVNLKDLLEMTIPLFTFGQVKLVKELQPVPPIEGDSEELQEVLVNLIQNALEAMPQGGTLTLKTYEQHGKVVLEVSDTGKGIPEELREKIFDPFFSTRHEGTGLGLSIVYRIVREHNGDISVESGVGSGSTFRVVF